MKCIFTHNIANELECDPQGNFDDYGFPIERCKMFPCEKYNNYKKELDDIKEYRKEIKK